MAFRIKFYHSLVAGLACVAMISGCCASGQCRKVRLPRVQLWPRGWARPTWMPSSNATPLPVPADPSGSPYSPQSPRGWYVPSGPAPESKLGLPVPPPLPPRGQDAPPSPESQPDPDEQSLPPDAEDLDVSFRGRSGRRQAVIAPPLPPIDVQPNVPRLAELPRSFEGERQPVSLGVPEAEFEPDLATEPPPQPSILRRSPVEAFPQPQRTANDFNRGGHTPPFDDIEIEDPELDEEPLPELIDPSSHERGLILPKPVPDLGDDDVGVTNASVHRQTSAERVTRSTKPKDASRTGPRLSVPAFRLTRDMRSGADADVISAQSLQRGQNLVVQAELKGLKAVQRSGELITRVSFHLEIRDARSQVLFATEKESSTETTHSSTEPRQLTKWLAIPTALKPGEYVLQAHLKDVFSRQVTVIELPVTIR